MAGGGESLGSGGGKKKRGKGKRRPKKRVGFRLDMTPLVDITFLLLTFFMLTTSMITPQTMPMNVPPEEVEIEVRQSELLTIRIREDGKMFYNTGLDAPVATNEKDLLKIVIDQNVKLKNRCIVVLKSAPSVPYGNVVTVLDILNLAERDIITKLREQGVNQRERKFTVAPMLEKDLEEIKGL